MTRLRVGDRAQNAHRKERMPCKASNEGLTATRALRTSRGSCNAEASRCITSLLCPITQPPTVACDSSRNMWPDSFRIIHEWTRRRSSFVELGQSRRSNGPEPRRIERPGFSIVLFLLHFQSESHSQAGVQKQTLVFAVA